MLFYFSILSLEGVFMNDILLELLETSNFNYALHDFGLAKYELLAVIHKAIFCNDSQFSYEKKDILR